MNSMPRHILTLIWAMTVSSAWPVHSQDQIGANGPSFSDDNWISMNGYPGVDGLVYVAVADGSGNLYIGGDFTIAGDAFANNIAKWNGTNWSALGSGIVGSDAFSRPHVVALALSGGDLY